MPPVPILLENKSTNFASNQTVAPKYRIYRNFRIATTYHTIHLFNKAFLFYIIEE